MSTQHSATSSPPEALPQLRARTIRLPREDAAHSDPTFLTDRLIEHNSAVWVRGDGGIIGWGETCRVETHGPDRFRDADRWWSAILGTAQVEDELAVAGSGLVAFGSFAFASDSPARSRLIVPRFVLGNKQGERWLTTISRADEPEPATMPVPDPVDDYISPGVVRSESGALSQADWMHAVADAVTRIQSSTIDKVVLARDEFLTTQHAIDPRWLIRRLAATYPSCWTFHVDGFLGATPEMLVRSQNGLVTSRVLAGTIRRTGNDDEDLHRAATLARSSKDLEEHEYAVKSVAEALRPHCSGMNVPDAPFVLHLPNVMHLASDVTGVLAAAATTSTERPPSSIALAEALHPSAAVCGTPTDRAGQLLAELEHMDRDRYAGPVGWVGAGGDGEWGIGLRSGLLDPNDPKKARLFAGCGIVAASQPSEEYAETEAKLQPMHTAFRADEDQ